MKAGFTEKIKILLSKAGLRELLRLEPCTGDQVDSSPGALNGGTFAGVGGENGLGILRVKKIPSLGFNI